MKDVPIIVFDFGSQYTQLIARRLREEGVYCEIVPYSESLEAVKAKNPRGLILSGGPASVYEEDAYMVDKGVFEMGLPILGICYGMQLITHVFGGEVVRADHHEYGKAKILFDDIHGGVSPLFKDIESNHTVWMSHADKVVKLPEGFVRIGHTDNAEFAAIANDEKKVYALQFHPEVAHSEFGHKMLKNFAKHICSLESTWNMGHFAKEQIAKIKEKVGNDKVLCAVSGGVDSMVTAALLVEAIGDNLIPVFVNNGVLRANEVEQVQDIFKHSIKRELITIDAEELFLGRLKGVTEPETKRKIIGHAFIELFEAEAKKHVDCKYLAQGTLYPDVIESVSVKGPSKTIKSHHNVGGLPDWMKFELVEPLRELFKDEVRKLGLELGLPAYAIDRHPFPGPGLAIRVMGEVNKPSLEMLRKADTIMIDELRASGYYGKVWQAFCVLLNVQSVGVMGDNRTYENTVCIRTVESSDGMTAVFGRLPFELLERMSSRIINEVDGINRVVYDISSKPPATIEWE
jgi:GMP synthase (glutamine-hydrolysing)